MTRTAGALFILALLFLQPSLAGTSGSVRIAERPHPLPMQPRAVSGPGRPQSGYSLAANHYVWYVADAYGSGTSITFTVSSSGLVDIMVMGQSQFSSFRVNGSTSTIYRNVVSTITETVALPSSGKYYLVVYNDQSSTSVIVTVDYSTVPVDIYSHYSSAPVPTGIADYGVENQSGTWFAYKQVASSVTGFATLNSLGAYNSSSQTEASPYGASLQLNVMLRVNMSSGQRVYWLQNVLSSSTNNNTAVFGNNIWNASAPGATLDPTRIKGLGVVVPAGHRNFYGTLGVSFIYAPPLDVAMSVAVSRAGNAAIVDFGYAEPSGGQAAGPTTSYDKVTITESQPVLDAGLVVSGSQKTLSGSFFDAELVFGGQCCAVATVFTSMDAVLRISYHLTDGSFTAPRSVFEFGSDTAEGAYNLQTTQAQNGYHVGLGRINFAQNYKLGPIIKVPLTVSYSVSDSTIPSTPPVLSFVGNGTQQTALLGTAPKTYTADGGSIWTVTSTVPGGK